MVPPAPTRFSTTTGCFHMSLRRSPSTRAETSVAPPAANGTTNLTVFCGQDCAIAAADTNRPYARAAADLTLLIELSSFVVVCERAFEIDPDVAVARLARVGEQAALRLAARGLAVGDGPL